jgi:glycosyltransferase involved in cell wall biosynthesis
MNPDSASAPLRPLRVVLIGSSFGGYGGIESFMLAIAGGLPTDGGVEARVVFKRAAGFALQPALAAAAGRATLVNRGSLALWRAVARADVVHLQNISPDVVLLARLLGRPLLLTVHNHSLGRASWRQRLWHRCLRLADRRFYVSEFVRRTWEAGAPRPGSRVVAPISRLPEGRRAEGGRRGFVFAARWIPNKGIETLVEAYARAGLDPERWPLRMIGDGPLRAPVEQAIRTRGLRGITVEGFLSEAEKHDAIRGARFMVIPPQTREDFGLTAIEARAVGVPCIITRDGGLPEAAGAEALACEPGDAAGLADCLRTAAAMPDAEYAGRAERTFLSLQGQLVRPADYAGFYREMVRR